MPTDLECAGERAIDALGRNAHTAGQAEPSCELSLRVRHRRRVCSLTVWAVGR